MAKLIIAGSSPGKFKESEIDENAIGGATSAKDEFDIGSEGITDLILSFDAGASDDIDVWVNGSLKRPGALNDYTVDDANDKVIFNYGLHENDWVRVRRY